MPVQNIRKIAEATFKVDWENIPNSQLKLSFKPIIEQFNLVGKFCLVHWQAKPKGLRRYGVYCSSNDEYYSCNYSDLYFDGSFLVNSLQIDENVLTTVPTAVLHFPESMVTAQNSLILIKNT